MNDATRGTKHICPDCATRYYDMKREVVACPRCGAAPVATNALRSVPRRTNRSLPRGRP